MLGVTIEVDGVKKHTYKDFGLGWNNVEISAPEPQTYYEDIPGMDGKLDLSESLTGDIQYKNRTIKLVFDIKSDCYEWNAISSYLLNFLHGKQAKIILDTDPSYFYIGRLKLTSNKEDFVFGELIIEGDIEPYKYEINTGSHNDWLWDTFNFEEDIIREYKDLKVNGTLDVNVYGNRKTVCPTFLADSDMQVKYNGNTYNIKANTETEILEIALREGDNILTFIGNGTVTINYRGGSL